MKISIEKNNFRKPLNSSPDDYCINLIGLDEYADRKCGTYSGGNKRKLSIGMALVADPPIIFFDEPSTGVDPVARRKLWNVISTIQQRGQSVVLTSHR